MPRKEKQETTLNDLMKYEIASELGLSHKVDKEGWGGLTAAETGKIGGLLSAKKKQLKRSRVRTKHKEGAILNRILH